MERRTFETSRTLEFFSEKELSMQIGQNRSRWAVSIIKELIDNSLDACETAGILPEITVDIGNEYFSVADNGPGLPEETLRRSLDYMVRVSDKNHYVSPSRGQLGNALKCVWAAPFVASRNGHSMVEVGTNGRRYVIDVQVDNIKQEPAVTMTESEDPFVKNGCFVKIHSIELAGLLTNDSSPFSYNINRVFDLMAGYSAFNPAAAFTLKYDGKQYVYPAKTDSINKWIPSNPTSVWWYDSERFKNLICAYLSDEKRGGRAKPIREFIAEFNGLKGTAKHKRILAGTGLSGAYLNSLVNGNGVEHDACEQLLLSMREESKPVKPAALGEIGESCLASWMSNYCSHESIRHRKRTGMVDNMPYVLEVALGIKETEDLMLFTGLNFSPALADPFYHLDYYLEQNLIDFEDPVVMAIHLTMPLLEFTDRGKSRLSLPDEVEKSLSDAVQYVAKEWTKLKKKKKREDRANYKEWAEREKRRKRNTYNIKEAAFQVMEEAYLNASANGTLPANARQIMYAARPKVIELAGKCWKNSAYFTQTLLNEYIDLFPEKTADWDVVYDARGKLVEPHTEKRVDIGTVAVRKYVKSWFSGVSFGSTIFRFSGEVDTQGPSCRYNYALFVEKEGFNELLNEAADAAEKTKIV